MDQVFNTRTSRCPVSWVLQGYSFCSPVVLGKQIQGQVSQEQRAQR